jgi:hypothetical protein
VALHGIELLDNKGQVLVQAGFFQNKNAVTREFQLDPDEKIVGIYSRIEKRYEQQAIHRDFQFIIAKKV